MVLARSLLLVLGVAVLTKYGQCQGISCCSCTAQAIGSSVTYKSITYSIGGGATTATTTPSTTTPSITTQSTTSANALGNITTGTITTTTATTTTTSTTIATTVATTSAVSISAGYEEIACISSSCYANADTCMTAKITLLSGFATYLYACTTAASCNDNYATSIFQSMYSGVTGASVVTQCCSTNGCNEPLLTPTMWPGSGSQSLYSKRLAVWAVAILHGVLTVRYL